MQRQPGAARGSQRLQINTNNNNNKIKTTTNTEGPNH
jgi:hypothetical protein